MKKLALMAMTILTMAACQNKENAYTIMDIDGDVADDIKDAISAIDGVYSVRVIH